MWFYWAMFAAPALASLSPARLTNQSRLIVVLGVSALLLVIIGLRDHVGADWIGYSLILSGAQTHSLPELLLAREPGFGLINWISIQLDWGVYGVDFFAAVIFVSGLTAFLLRQPNFWRCLTLTVPVLIIQMAMSGIRQAAAIGFLFFALNAFTDRRLIRYLIFVLLAFTMHQTAVVFFLPALFMKGRIRFLPALAAGVALLLVSVFLFKDPDFYKNAYVLQDQGAVGALPRIAFNALAAILFWKFAKRWSAEYADYRLFAIMAVATVVISPFVFFAQVAVDRIEYYLIPFQVAVISRIPELLSARLKMTFMTIIYTGYAGALAVWMNFSWIAQLAWMPYRTVIFGANQ